VVVSVLPGRQRPFRVGLRFEFVSTPELTGSAVPKVTSAVSGGQWTVDSTDGWGIDTVGWLEGGANYYQASALDLPCYVTGPQRMLISCQTQTTFVAYIENTLEDGVLLSGAVSSQRQSNYQQRVWP